MVSCWLLRQLPLATAQLTTTVFAGTGTTFQSFGMCLPSPPADVGLWTIWLESRICFVGAGPALTTFCGSKRYHCEGVPLPASVWVAGAVSSS